MSSFVHLRLHTEYSLSDGLVRISRPKEEADSPHAYLVEALPAAGMAAVAVTDQNNLFAMVKFYTAAVAAGIKPIIGADVSVQGEGEAATRLTLLCQNEPGLRNLSQLLTRAYIEAGQGLEPMLKRAWITEHHTGLIALSGAREGDVGRALLNGKIPQAQAALQFWTRLFGDRYYLEVQRSGRPEEEAYLEAALDLAQRSATPVVATNDVRFLRREDFDAHEARVCIHQSRMLNDPRRPHSYSPEQYLRSPQEMAELFTDIPEAIENSVEIAKRCNVALTLGQTVMPQFPVPGNLTPDEFFRREAAGGLERRLAAPLAPRLKALPAPDYQARLALELDVICKMGFTGYFLIVADFVRWAKDNGVPVGPGRGSGAGSLVAYCLGITDLDPLRYELLFERFLNPERVSMPDFDIDFCMEGRDRVIEYVAERYGRDRVSQIITYGSMAARAVVRDVGRVMGHGYGFVDRIAKLIPFELGMTLVKALAQEPELQKSYEEEEDVRAILDMAMALEGLARNAGKHAGGVVIAPAPLTEFTPLYCEPGGKGLVTQLDKDDVEAIGLIKFDFLGLRTLTIIDRAVRHIRAVSAPDLNIESIPLDDARTYALIKRQQTTAVFQLESRGIRDIIKRLKPDRFEDIVALVALYRPGPLQSGMVEDFIERKHGRGQVSYFHPSLEPILKPTYGVILYQEQVMQIAQVLAGYSLGEADLLRRAMGKKKPEEMAKQREIFVEGSKARGVDARLAETLFDLMEKFAGYGFNKSHSVAYALLAYQTAWLKANHAAAFMAAVLSADMDHTDKIVNFIDECRALKLKVVPPDVNRSGYAFSALNETTVLYGLGAIKGVGQGAVDALVQEREQRGAYADLTELCRRCDSQKLNRRGLEAMLKSGAFDSLDPNRAGLMTELPEAMKSAEQMLRDLNHGQVDLFGSAQVPAARRANGNTHKPWDEAERLAAEKEALGLYLTGHPVSRYADELRAMCGRQISDLSLDDAGAAGWRQEESTTRIAGLVTSVRVRAGNTGKNAFVMLDDRSGRIEVAVFADDLRKHSELINKDQILVIEGGLSFDEFAGALRLRARKLMDLDQARAQYAKRLEIIMSSPAGEPGTPVALEKLLSMFRGGSCPILLIYRSPEREARLQFGEEWRIRPCEELLLKLHEIPGIQSAELRYR